VSPRLVAAYSSLWCCQFPKGGLLPQKTRPGWSPASVKWWWKSWAVPIIERLRRRSWEARTSLRLFYRNWRPTRLGLWIDSFWNWWSGLGLPPRFQPLSRSRGRKSGRKRSNPVVIASVDHKRCLVSMHGPESEWVKNVEAAHGYAFIRQGRRHHVHLELVPPEQRAPIVKEYVQVAISGRHHFRAKVGARFSGLRGDCKFLSCIQNRPLLKRFEQHPSRCWNDRLKRDANPLAFKAGRRMLLAPPCCGSENHIWR